MSDNASAGMLLGADNTQRDYFDLFGDEPAVPDANELLSLKILKDANPDSFKGIAAEETKWIALALGLLRNDPYLQIRLKGKGIRSAMKLAGHLKRKAEQKHFDDRLEKVILATNDEKFKEQGWDKLKPLASADNIIKIKKVNNVDTLHIDAMGGAAAQVYRKTT